MNFRQKLSYTVIGGASMRVVILTANHATPIKAEYGSLGNLTCTG